MGVEGAKRAQCEGNPRQLIQHFLDTSPTKRLPPRSVERRISSICGNSILPSRALTTNRLRERACAYGGHTPPVRHWGAHQPHGELVPEADFSDSGLKFPATRKCKRQLLRALPLTTPRATAKQLSTYDSIWTSMDAAGSGGRIVKRYGRIEVICVNLSVCPNT